jgi:hypothetical protein
LVFTAITGPTAPEPFSEEEVENSNCHPTLPETNDLTLVYAYNTSATVYSNSTVPVINGITPVLTVFFSPNASNVEDAIQEPDAHLICLRQVGVTDAALENEGESAGMKMAAGMGVVGAMMAGAVAVLI